MMMTPERLASAYPKLRAIGQVQPAPERRAPAAWPSWPCTTVNTTTTRCAPTWREACATKSLRRAGGPGVRLRLAATACATQPARAVAANLNCTSTVWPREMANTRKV